MKFNMSSKLLQFLKWFITRVGIFYLGIFLVLYFMVNLDVIWRSGRLRALNRIMPSFDKIAEFNVTGKALTDDEWKEYAHYYKVVSKIAPDHGATFFFLGFCQAQLGQDQKAIKNFQIAVQKDPRIFWFNYNLGLAFYNQKEYAKAVEWLEKAISIGGENIDSYIIGSKIYTQVVASDVLEDYNFEEPFYKAFVNAHLVTAKCHYLMHDDKMVMQVLQYTFSRNLALNSDFYRLAGRSLKRQGRFREAAEVLQIGMEGNPVNLGLLIDLEDTLRAAGLMDEVRRIDNIMGSLEKFSEIEKPLIHRERYSLF